MKGLSEVSKIIPLACAILIICTSGAAFGLCFTYQGIATDTAGNPVDDTLYSFTFSIFSDSVSGERMWSETKELSTKNGLFMTLLGNKQSLEAVDFSELLWLETAFDGAALAGRTPLGSVARAAYSYEADSARIAHESYSLIGTQPFSADTEAPPDAIHIDAAGSVSFSEGHILLAAGNLGVQTDTPKSHVSVGSQYAGATISGGGKGAAVYGTNLMWDNAEGQGLKTAGTHSGEYGYAGMVIGRGAGSRKWADISFISKKRNTIEGELIPDDELNSPHLFINSNGRVGLGTSSPGATLDVAGSLKASDTVSANAFQENGRRCVSNVDLRFIIDANTTSFTNIDTIIIPNVTTSYSLDLTIGFYGNRGSGNANFKGIVSGHMQASSSHQARFEKILMSSHNNELNIHIIAESPDKIIIQGINTDPENSKIARGYYTLVN